MQARGLDAAAVLRQKMDFILLRQPKRWASASVTPGGPSCARWLTVWAISSPEEFLGWPPFALGRGRLPWPRITSEHAAYFYTLRGAGPDRDLVNMPLSELSPMDVRQMFIVHKELFYAHYARWSEAKRQFVADFLEREYKVDAQGAREALFGPRTVDGCPRRAAPPEARPRIRAAVGPWARCRGREDDHWLDSLAVFGLPR